MDGVKNRGMPNDIALAFMVVLDCGDSGTGGTGAFNIEDGRRIKARGKLASREDCSSIPSASGVAGAVSGACSGNNLPDWPIPFAWPFTPLRRCPGEVVSCGAVNLSQAGPSWGAAVEVAIRPGSDMEGTGNELPLPAWWLPSAWSPTPMLAWGWCCCPEKTSAARSRGCSTQSRGCSTRSAVDWPPPDLLPHASHACWFTRSPSCGWLRLPTRTVESAWLWSGWRKGCCDDDKGLEKLEVWEKRDGPSDWCIAWNADGEGRHGSRDGWTMHGWIGLKGIRSWG